MGKYLRQFGKEGEGDGRLFSPTGICIDSDDTVYVGKIGNHRVSVFTHEGTFLTSFVSYGDGSGQFFWPQEIHVTVDKNGIIYVSDHLYDRLQIF